MSLAKRDIIALLPAVLRIRDRVHALQSTGLLTADELEAFLPLKQAVDNGVPLSSTDQTTYLSLNELSQAGPLASLLAVLAEQIAAMQDNVEQLYDDQFVETCAPWVLPYIGDLIGYQPLHGPGGVASRRAEVAHTVRYRRRKGTVAVLEQLGKDVTGWSAAAVEFFQHLIVTQHMNHRRPQCVAAPDLRQGDSLELFGTPFDTVMRTPEMRRIAVSRGRYNIPNIGVFLWTIAAYPLTGSPAAVVDTRRYRFHPLDIDEPLYQPPALAQSGPRVGENDVPHPISRRRLRDLLDAYRQAVAEGIPVNPAQISFAIHERKGGITTQVSPANICACNLQDHAGTWANLGDAPGMYEVDPVLGRLVAPPDLAAGTELLVDFCYGFTADMGGGEYPRQPAAGDDDPPLVLKVPGDHATIQAALDTLGTQSGVVEIQDSGRYEESLSAHVHDKATVVLRALDRHRPTIILRDPFAITGGEKSAFVLRGLLLAGAAVTSLSGNGNALARLSIEHCTLVPGLTLEPDGSPVNPTGPSAVVGVGGLNLGIAFSIAGALRVNVNSTCQASDSIIDATAVTNVAYAGEDDTTAGGPLTLERCTVAGKIHALTLPLVSDSILLASLAAGDSWQASIVADRLQEGCMRFTFLPTDARVPRRYRCLPESAPAPDDGMPDVVTMRCGSPAYMQLATTSGAALFHGASNECQPGVFNFLLGQQRETNLRVRLAEYVRIGLEAGVFYES